MRSPTIKLFSEQISEANAQRDDAISRLSIAQQEIANKDRLALRWRLSTTSKTIQAFSLPVLSARPSCWM